MAFKIRNTKPEKGNPYYNTKANGGYSTAIKGSPTDKDCDVLANCVGYAFGRFNEIGGYGYMKYLKPVNAEKFMMYKGDLKTGSTPKVGAVMVWQKGTSSASDGAGHVAIVEKVIDANTVMTSESGYGAKQPFTYRERKKSDGIWGKDKSKYTFLGFIYQPTEVKTTTTTSTTKTSTTTSTSSTLKAGSSYTLKTSLKGYKTAAEALAGKNAVSTCEKGTYYIYKISGKAYNITKTKGKAGAWINPALNK